MSVVSVKNGIPQQLSETAWFQSTLTEKDGPVPNQSVSSFF